MYISTYTTGKNMEYLESTVDALVFDILILHGLAPTPNKYCDFYATHI